MNDEKFNLIFSSAKVSPENQAEIQKKIATILKTNETEIKKLFNGKKVRFIKNIHYKLAKTLSMKITHAGALCTIERYTPEQSKKIRTNTSPPSLSLTDTESTSIKATFYCPKCKLQQSQKNTCIHCQSNLLNYRKKMKGNGLYEIKGKGYVHDQRKIHRRESHQRREMIRLEGAGNRRQIADRRHEDGEWGDVWG